MANAVAKFFRRNGVGLGELLFQSANLFSTVLSFAVVASGGYLLYGFDRYSPLFQTFVFRNVGQLITLLGCFGVAFTLVGCLFFHYKKKGLVGLYVVSVTIIYCGEVGAGLVLVEKKGEVKNSTREVLENILYKQYGLQSKERETQSIDMVQKRFECCGIDHWQDWFKSSMLLLAGKSYLSNATKGVLLLNSSSTLQSELLHRLLRSKTPHVFFNPINTNHVTHILNGNVTNKRLLQAIPSSCCITDKSRCQWRGPWNINKEGCLNVLTNEFTGLSELVGIFVAIIGFIQVTGTIFGACIVKCVRACEVKRNSPI